MKALWRLRQAVAEASPLLQPACYRLHGDTAHREAVGGWGSKPWSPWTMRIQGGVAAEHDGLIRRSDCRILLAADRGHVTRLYRDPKKVEHLVVSSQWLRPAFPCPDAVAVDIDLPGWHGVREGFVSGTLLCDAEPGLWHPVYREFLRCCADNARRCEDTVDPAAWFAELDTWKLPGATGETIRRWRAELAEVLTDAPRLRSHADAHNGNLLVTGEGRLAVIDVERVEEQPFFFDALSLPRGSEAVNAALRRDYLAGAFDDELKAIWAAAGQTFRPQLRVPYLLAVAVAHAFRPQFATSPAERRREKLLKAVEKFADEIIGESPTGGVP